MKRGLNDKAKRTGTMGSTDPAHLGIAAYLCSSVLVFMPMMQVRIVGMFVKKPSVPAQVSVGLAGRIVGRMRMLVMRIVDMAVLVLQPLVKVLVLVRLGKVQIDADAHQQCRGQEGKGDRLTEERERKCRADEGRGREVSTGARSA